MKWLIILILVCAALLGYNTKDRQRCPEEELGYKLEKAIHYDSALVCYYTPNQYHWSTIRKEKKGK